MKSHVKLWASVVLCGVGSLVPHHRLFPCQHAIQVPLESSALSLVGKQEANDLLREST